VAGLAEILLEYVLGFGFGWMVFQALFMHGMAAVKNYQAEVRRDVEALSARQSNPSATAQQSHAPLSEKFAQTACSRQR
jgi:hypothetical protein